MSTFQERIEALGGSNPATGNGYILCTYAAETGRIVASAVPYRVLVKRLSRFELALRECVALRPDDVTFAISDYRPKSPCIITLETPEKEFLPLFTSFVLYLGQSRLLTNPIVCCKFRRVL